MFLMTQAYLLYGSGNVFIPGRKGNVILAAEGDPFLGIGEICMAGQENALDVIVFFLNPVNQ